MLRTNKSRWIVTLVAFLLVAVVLIAFGVKISQQDKTKKVGLLNYSIGAIGSNGKVVESKKSLYTKDFLNVKGLEIVVKDDAQCTYKVAFYDEDKEFVEITESQNVDFDAENVPASAKYFRVMITPNQIDEEDVTVTILNMSKYAGMLSITCNK